MVAEFTRFSGFTQSLLPQNVEAEESLLGAILLDPEAIGRVVDKLRPEAFYITAHATIYKAAIAIHGQGNPVDLMSVTTWLYDHNQLDKVGGQCRLAEILDRTVSSVNVDRYAELVIDKYIRRELIAAGNEIIRFGYESFRNLPEIFTEAKERISSLVDSPLLSGEDPDQLAYNKLCLEIQQIELGCADPGMRLWKLQKLAQQYGRSTKQLEAIYFMSLLKEENESLLTWKELSDRYGDQVREWLLHGFLPKGVVIALHAKGGVGKTRLAYDMLHTLLTGGSWNGFPTTGPRRAIVIQTDESAGDMLDALRKRGFDENLDNIRYKTRWTFEHIPQLVKEVQEFNPEVIVMDSITSMSRHSLFSENDVQYARPILKLKDLAQMLGCTIILIHHSSKAGEARGTSAIFNSVSEVWKLERDLEDKSPDSTKRLLTIEKSRSRRPTTYKLDFEPDQGSWSLLGEVGVDENNPDLSTKERIVEFLLKNLGDRFEATEISHEISGSLPRVRLCCSRLSADGIISQTKPATKGRGKANLYFIGVKSDRSNDRGEPEKMNLIGGGDHFNSLEESIVQPQADPSVTGTAQKECEGGGEKSDRAITLRLEPSNRKVNTVIALPDRAKDHLNGQAQCDHLIGTPDQEQGWTKKLFGAVKERDDRQSREDLPESPENDRGAIIFFRAGDIVWWDDDHLAGEYEIESSSGGVARLKGISHPVAIHQLTIVRIVEGTGEELGEPTDEAQGKEISVPVRSTPYHPRTNPPKKGDHVRSGSGKSGQITLTRNSNPKYEITWEDGRVMGYTFEDLETCDIRREN
jgi:replicative DNA helicase